MDTYVFKCSLFINFVQVPMKYGIQEEATIALPTSKFS